MRVGSVSLLHVDVPRLLPAVSLSTALDRSTLVTALAVLGVACGLVIAGLLSQDPREAGASAVACIMIGGAIALGRAHERRDALDVTPSLEAVEDTALLEAHRQMRAVAHDLKAPLLTVSSYLDLIASGALGAVPDEVRVAACRAQEVSERARQVVDSTLRRESPGAAVCADERVDLNATVSQVAAALTSAMRERRAAIAVEGRLPVVRGDDASLFRVFENLVQNSIKFCPAGTTPRIGLCSRDLDATTVEVMVTDNGPGMPSSVGLLAMGGMRGANAQGTPGQGLGLATVSQLVGQMGGSVSFEDAPGGGAAVRLVLRSA